MNKMCGNPFDEGVCIVSHGCLRRIGHVLEDRIEYRSRLLRQIGHELTEFAVEVIQDVHSHDTKVLIAMARRWPTGQTLIEAL
jgi:hypothetical protein